MKGKPGDPPPVTLGGGGMLVAPLIVLGVVLLALNIWLVTR